MAMIRMNRKLVLLLSGFRVSTLGSEASCAHLTGWSTIISKLQAANPIRDRKLHLSPIIMTGDCPRL